MPIRNGDYETRTQQAVFDSLVNELLDEEPDANPRSESTMVYAILWAVAGTIAENQEVSLRKVYRSAYIVDASGEELTKKAQNLGVTRREAVRATGVVTFSRESTATQDYVIPSGTVVETVAQNPVQFETIEQVTLTSGTSSVDATVRALDGGSDGNVGPNAIESIPTKPAGVGSVTNANPTGDPTLTDTDGDPLVAGRDREGDDELRQRVLDIDASDEGPSANGVELAISDVEDVISIHVNENPTNSTVDGLDPYSQEVVVYGGETFDIGMTLYETMSAISLLRLQGGVNGTKETTSIYSELLDQQVTIPITRPTPTTFDLNLDIVHTNTYEGDVAVKDTIVEYIGGVRADDSTTVGLGLGEDVLVNEIENRTEDIQGVDYAEVTLIDTNGDGTDDTTTDSDGVPVLAISNSSVPRLDADDVTISKTER